MPWECNIYDPELIIKVIQKITSDRTTHVVVLAAVAVSLTVTILVLLNV